MSEALKLNLLPIDIEIVSGPHLGQVFNFQDKEIIKIGRDIENDIKLSNDPRVSRFHAEIKFSDGNYYIYNLSQKNFILINGEKEDQKLLTGKSILTIGETEIKVNIFQTLEKTNTVSSPIPFKNPLQPLPNKPLVGPVSSQRYGTPASVGSPYQQAMSQAQNYGQVAYSPRPNSPQRNLNKSNDKMLIIIGGIIAVVVLFLIFSGSDKEGDIKNSKATPIVVPILEEEVRLKRAEEELNKKSEFMKDFNSRKQMARTFMVSGMREYNNGQYLKAIEYLASAFQSDPTLEDAAKYHQKAKQKLDKLIEFNFLEGKKYRESGNYRMCKASFQTVLFYIKNNIKHPRYSETKLFYDECHSLEEVGRL
ncbi:MAG: FHA domain-containing protein [Bdellovibrionaceae bacterium]|nr:FHA domain-containing protein [Pseudobdellovibrionaceae bacterium]NUM60094.1 FHA domain-containing protein [Pseudobdellovibrionaceae bacterium]